MPSLTLNKEYFFSAASISTGQKNPNFRQGLRYCYERKKYMLKGSKLKTKDKVNGGLVFLNQFFMSGADQVINL